MKVLHIETGRQLAGGPQQVVTLMKGLEAHGVDSTLLCPEDSAVAELAKSAQLKVKRVPYKGEHDFSIIKAIRETVKDRHFDLMHAHSRRGADNYTAIVARRTKIPAILTRRVINVENNFIAGPKYRSFKKVVAVSEAVERSLKRQRVDSDLRMTIHDGINLQDYTEQYSREHLLAEFNLPDNAFIIGNVGRFTENKGQLSLLEAFTLIHKKYPQTHLILFGEGEMLDDLVDYVKKHQLTEQVHFAGFRMDMPKWYGALQVVVHTAMLEALSVALLEAGASGVPLIAYNNGGISEVIRHMHNGMLVQPGQVDQLADAIQRLLESRTLTKRLADNSKKTCAQNFSAERMVSQYHQLYTEILHTQRAMKA